MHDPGDATSAFDRRRILAAASPERRWRLAGALLGAVLALPWTLALGCAGLAWVWR